MAGRVSILHLSDCHFGEGHYFRRPGERAGRISLTNAVSRALGDQSVDALVLSGDVFSRPGEDGESELEHARSELDDLVTELDIAIENVVLVPGNHDLARGADDADAFAHLDQLAGELGLAPATVSELPYVKILDFEPRVALVLFDSCLAESGDNPGIGLIGEEQREEALNLIREQQVDPASDVILAVLHHHLLPVVDQELVNRDNPRKPPLRKPSLTTDASETLQMLSDLGVSLVLHGHQHQPALLEYRDRLLSPSRTLSIAGAGSCGAESRDNNKRQFWLHEIESGGIYSTAYEQASRNGSRFDKREPIRLPRAIAEAASGFDGCLAHAESTFESSVVERPGEDRSNLILVLMSVTDCAKARRIIREYVEEIRSRQDEAEPPAEIAIDGMYDLLGYWDLLVRARTPHTVNASYVFEPILRELEEQGARISEEDDFHEYRIVDVARELPDLAWYANRAPQANVELRRTRLPTTEDYDRLRSQRVYLYFKLPDNGKDRFIADISDAIHKAGVSTIIETVAVSDNEIVLDIFLRCADSAAVNLLNRAIEPILSRKRIQKYTMLCYSYDENLPPATVRSLPMTPV